MSVVLPCLSGRDITGFFYFRLLEIRGITERRLEDIKSSYAENRMLQDLMNLLAPFKLTPKTALKIYQHFGPSSLETLKKSPFELCQISGFGFRRVDAIVQKSGGSLNDPMRIRGAVHCALGEAKSIIDEFSMVDMWLAMCSMN